MIALFLAGFVQAFTCPGRGVLSNGVRPSGAFDCVTWSSTDFERDDTHPIRIEHHRIVCRRGTQPVVQLDGKSARCIRIGADA